MFSRFAFIARSRPILTTVLSMAPVVVVSQAAGSASASAPPDETGKGSKAHHKKGGGFVNPWESFQDLGMNPWIIWQMRKDWVSRPVPSADALPPVTPPVFTPPSSLSASEREAWLKDLKATWLGHACFLVEFPAQEGKERGMRVLFDPVFECRCSPSQWIGPKRVVPAPVQVRDLPTVDAVVISHSHYDHTSYTTLRELYAKQEKGSVHFFAPLGNKVWFEKNVGCGRDEVTELDWWEEREVRLGEKEGKEGEASLRVVCTPCQHFAGRTPFDRNETLWASWSISSSTGGKVWFGGDTGYRSVPRGFDPALEHTLPHCPAFKEIGEKEGPFDLGLIPIGAYSPRWFMSRIHCNPEDSVEVHRDVKSKKSLGMHMGTWVLTDEPMDEPPKRLRAAAEKYGISEEEFGVSGLGETTRVKV